MTTNSEIAHNIYEQISFTINESEAVNLIAKALDAKDSEAAVLRQALEKLPHHAYCNDTKVWRKEPCNCGIDDALSSTTAGKALLERVEKLEAAADTILKLREET